MSLLEKLKKNSKVKETAVLQSSSFFKNTEFISTEVPLINLALSGDVDGGLTSGITTIAGPSKHFKTSYSLIMMKAFLDKHEDGVVLFYDTEFGSPQAYFKQFGIDTSRILHTPIKNIEELKFDCVSQLENINRDENVMIVIDSIGNIASKKEIEDALSEKSVADMTRAKQLKSFFRMVTPYVKMKNMPLVAIAHTYDTQEMFSKKVISGGTGIVYSSDTAWIVGRSQNKKGTEIEGYNFTINIEKSRFVKEKSKFNITVSWDGGIQKFSGLLDDALEGGYVEKPKVGWYTRPIVPDDKNFREKDTRNEEFWKPIFENTDFKNYLKQKYTIGEGELLQEPSEDLEDEE